jgi:hypothetical protein
MDAQAHWENIYGTKAPDAVSWYRPHLERSLDLIESAAPVPSASIVGVGGGESTLVADLFARGYRNITLSKQSVDSALAREIVAELRNEGHVEEEVRGTIRLTPRGYRAFQNDPSPYSYRSR